MWWSFRRGDSQAIDGECRWDAPAPEAASAPSGDGGGGSLPPSSPTPDPTPAPVDPASDPAASASPERAAVAPELEDDDEVDVERDEDHADLPFKDHPRFKALTRKNRKLAKSLAKTNARTSELAQRAAFADRIEAAFRDIPELSEAITTGDFSKLAQRGRSATRPPAPEAQAEGFDPAAFPIDTSTVEGRYLFEQSRALHDANALVRQLSERIERLEGHTVSTQRRSEQQTWKTATDAAAAQIRDEGVRQVFMDAVYGAYREGQTRNVRIKPQDVIGYYLKTLKVSATETARAQAASTQASARHAAAQPRPLPPAAPVPPGAPRKRELLADVHRRIRGQG